MQLIMLLTPNPETNHHAAGGGIDWARLADINASFLHCHANQGTLSQCGMEGKGVCVLYGGQGCVCVWE